MFKNLKSKIKKIKTVQCFSSLPALKGKGGKIVKYGLVFVLPLSLALTGAICGVVEYNKKDRVNNSIVVDNSKTYRRIYLVDQEGLTIPLTVSIEKKSTVQEEVLDVFNLIKDGSIYENSYLNGLINKETSVKSFVIKDGIMTLNLSKEFLEYDNIDELKMLESLTLTMMQFDGVDGVKLQVDGNSVKSMPISKYVIPDILDLSFGVNDIMESPRNMIGKQKVTMLYNRSYDANNQYLVPVTMYTEMGKTLNMTFANAINNLPPIEMQLTLLKYYSQISSTQNESEKFDLIVNQTALVDEVTVNKDLYNIVKLSLDFMGISTPISFSIEGESLKVDGLIEEDSQSVSSIIYNNVAI